MLVKMKRPLEIIGPHHALVFAAMGELGPVIARYAHGHGSGSERDEGTPVVARRITSILHETALALGLAESMVICDATTNTPAVLDSGGLRVMVAVRETRTPFRWAGYFTLRRIELDGRSGIEVDYIVHPASDSVAEARGENGGD